MNVSLQIQPPLQDVLFYNKTCLMLPGYMHENPGIS